jgi:hypothetical protein
VKPLAVFAVAAICRAARHAETSPAVQPPTGINQNLAAQAGVLIRHDWACRDYWRPEYDYRVESATKSVDARVATRFLRLELPGNQASALLDTLADRGVDGASVFPGVHGLVASALDRAWCELRLGLPA